MKHLILISIIFILFFSEGLSQSGVYKSNIFAFRNRVNPEQSRYERTSNLLVFNIIEIKNEFLYGQIFWEMNSDNAAEILEIYLNKLDNSSYDESTSSFTRIFDAEIKLLGQSIQKVKVTITKNPSDYQLDIYDPVKKTVNSFKEIEKLKLD